jgi:hypothetical protein
MPAAIAAAGRTTCHGPAGVAPAGPFCFYPLAPAPSSESRIPIAGSW